MGIKYIVKNGVQVEMPADYVVYDNGNSISSADILLPEWVAFIEAEIAEGASFHDAQVAWDIECGER